MARFLGNLQ